MSCAEQVLNLVTADGAGQARLTLGGQGGVPVRHHFTVSTHIFNSIELNLQTRHQVLLLANDLSGYPELGNISVRTDLGDDRRGQVLMELLRIARDSCRAQGSLGQGTSFLIVELEGAMDHRGRSPFWKGLGHHFLPGELSELRACGSHSWNARLAAVLPRQIIYTSMLDPKAQTSLGQPRHDQAWLSQGLLSDGFMPYRHVRIDDGGPVLICRF